MKIIKKYIINKLRALEIENVIIIFLVPIMLFGLVLTIKQCSDVEKRYIKYNKMMLDYIGDSVIINNKTYIIVDYNLSENKLKLDNGATINVKLLEKLKIN